jgi:hypothetical protein
VYVVSVALRFPIKFHKIVPKKIHMHAGTNSLSQKEDHTMKYEYLPVIPDDLLCRVISYLDAPSLCRMRLVNSFCYKLASSNEAWGDLCLSTWKRKVHVPAEAIHMDNRMLAFLYYVEDAKRRHHVTLDELCYDTPGRSTVWSFRFKRSAGSEWTSLDPWYNGGECRKLVFFKVRNKR